MKIPTEHPNAQWTRQQTIEAFPSNKAPKLLLRDRDAIFGSELKRCTKSMGIEEALTMPYSPWQNAFVKRLIGNIRRDCLDNVIVLKERPLKRNLASYFDYFHRCQWITLNRDRYGCPRLERSCNFQKSVAYIITNGCEIPPTHALVGGGKSSARWIPVALAPGLLSSLLINCCQSNFLLGVSGS
jgi:hypothetical protein